MKTSPTRVRRPLWLTAILKTLDARITQVELRVPVPNMMPAPNPLELPKDGWKPTTPSDPDALKRAVEYYRSRLTDTRNKLYNEQLMVRSLQRTIGILEHQAKTGYSEQVSKAGAKLFEVECKYNRARDDYDREKKTSEILRQAIEAGKVREKNIQASADGRIELSFLPVVNYAFVNAIEILPAN